VESWRKIVALAACVAVIFGGVVFWRAHRKRAVEWRRLSDAATKTLLRAQQGDAAAEVKLASLYYDGKGVPQDYGEVIRWCRNAAQQDYAKGQYCLGDMYYHGLGVSKDYGEAVRWIQKAAEQVMRKRRRLSATRT
jgi:TPR repeat protein